MSEAKKLFCDCGKELVFTGNVAAPLCDGCGMQWLILCPAEPGTWHSTDYGYLGVKCSIAGCDKHDLDFTSLPDLLILSGFDLVQPNQPPLEAADVCHRCGAPSRQCDKEEWKAEEGEQE